MSKVIKKYKIKNCDNLIICKHSDSDNWLAKFYVGRHIKKSGMLVQSLRTNNQLEAEKKAKELWFEIKSKYNLSVFGSISSEYVFDKIATEFLNHQDKEYAITKKSDTDKSVTTHIRERSKYERVIKGFLGNLDIRRINYGHLERIKFSLISQNKSSSTISRYFDCISKILNYAVRLNIITKKPVMPKIERHDKKSYQPYTKDEVNLITGQLRKEKLEEIADIVNFLSFTHLRAGKEYLSIKHKDISFLKHFKTKQDILIITPPHRKVMIKVQPIPTHPIIAEIYKNRICNRYPEHSKEDFIFFPNNQDRELVRRRVYKQFVRVSKKLNLYVCQKTKTNRPLYSLRAYGFIEVRDRGATLQDIASVGNTSSKMLEERYLGDYNNQKMIDLYNRLYGKK